MVGWLRWREGGWRPHTGQVRPLGCPLMEISLPPGAPERRQAQGARRLRRLGVRRVLCGPGLDDPALLARYGLTPVEALPLCRAKGAELALALLEGVPLRARTVALRGERADPAAWAIADGLCPRVGQLLLDLDRGEGRLCAHLRAVYGAAVLHLGQGPEPLVSVELSPRPDPVGEPLQLWGAPDLRGLALGVDEALPAGLPPLPFLALLWETGRVPLGEIQVLRGRNVLDRMGESTYNTG